VGIKLHAFIVSTVVMMLLVGCATPCDPSKDGFFNGIGNLFNGCYKKRLEKKKKEYDKELSNEQASKKRLEKHRQEQAAVEEKLDKANQRLMDLEHLIQQQLEAIQKDRERTNKAQKKLRELKKAQEQLELVRRKIAQTRKNDLPVGDLKERSGGILKELDDIDEIVKLIQNM